MKRASRRRRPRARTVTRAVAVVDDEEGVRRALARLLGVAGHEAVMFGSGEDFLASLAVARPCCVILDLHMPGMDGLAVLRMMSSDGRRVPAIVITGHDSPEARAGCLAAGAAGYLCKPFDDQQLLRAIDEAVRSAQGPSPAGEPPVRR